MDRDQAYRLALVLEARARLDASTWVARLPRQVSLLARGRADQIIEPNRADPLRTALSREWYVRVFTDHARNQLGLGRAEIEVTPTETEHLAECLRAGVAYRIHGPGGLIVANPDGPEVAPGQANLVERQEDIDAAHGLTEKQTRRVLEALADDQDRRRAEDQRIVGSAWDELTPDQRTAFAEYWHRQHQARGHGAFPAAAPVRDAAAGTTAGAAPTTASRSAVSNRAFAVNDSGRRTSVAGRPDAAAAEVFGTEAADLAAARTAYALAAQAFPRGQSKPPTITAKGTVRSEGHQLPDVERSPAASSRLKFARSQLTDDRAEEERT